MLNIHLGPHKTASTYIQSVFKNSSWKQGFRYFNIFESRGGLLAELQACREGELPVRLQDSSLNYVLSDENMIGGPAGPLNMYPNVSASLRFATGRGAHLFFALRPYHELFVSSWTETLRFRPYFPFREGPEGRGYPEIMAELEQNVKPEAITLWDYRDFRHNSRSIMELISGGGISAWGEADAESSRVTPSADAVDLYEKLVPHISRASQPAVFNVIRQCAPMNTDRRPQPYKMSDIARLEERFARDLALLHDRYGLYGWGHPDETL